MVRYFLHRWVLTLLFISCAVPPSIVWSNDTELSPTEILQKSNSLYGGDDTTSQLTFRFREKGSKERKIVYTMIWKIYPDDEEIDQKMIFFKDFPAQEKGVSYMLWTYKTKANREDDQWLYLPELRTVRKLSKKVETGGRKKRNDDKNDFSKSVLERPHLTPRYPGLDKLRIVRIEKIKSREYYVIERIPKETSPDHPYAKTLSWIDKQDFVVSKIEYFNEGNEKILIQRFKWQKVGKAWVWEKVLGKKPLSGQATLIEVKKLKVNSGLKDSVFSKRTMKLGISGVR